MQAKASETKLAFNFNPYMCGAGLAASYQTTIRETNESEDGWMGDDGGPPEHCGIHIVETCG
jgi:hypothetical protein